jgi:hypothetical protein
MTDPATPSQSIDDIITQLEGIIERCHRERSRLGYFAALYRDVTIRVRDDIAAGRFEDGPRMERLDVIFAGRYLDALARYWRGEEPTRCWSVAFEAASRWQPVILQHLLLGMNAHINLDLAIAAAQTAPGNELPGLKRDFDEITVLLNELIDGVQERIGRVSPWMRIIDYVGGRTDEAACAFSIQAARKLAWNLAEKLSVAEPEAFDREIAVNDLVVAGLGHAIRSPGPLLRGALLLARLRETREVSTVIAALRI